ncbi:MAG: DNA-binding protein [Ignavibacteria bacterium]|nr:DNA-binding protein [Ignavibacteria bacterium]
MIRTSLCCKRTFVGSLPYGSDLYNGLTTIAIEENIRIGRISALGATTFATVAFYSQSEKKYLTLTFTEPMEILSCFGNISIRDEKPFVHAHIVLSDIEGKTFSGHLIPGTKLFACEVFIDELVRDDSLGYENEFARTLDEQTGLYLWNNKSLI